MCGEQARPNAKVQGSGRYRSRTLPHTHQAPDLHLGVEQGAGNVTARYVAGRDPAQRKGSGRSGHRVVTHR
jgi:hypothetical protein